MSDETIADRVQHAAERAIADRVANLVFAVWDHTLGLLVNLILISRHAKDLSYWKDMLVERKKDVSIAATHEARKNHAELGEQLKGWMKRVADLSKEATDFEASFNEPFCITGFCLGYEAVDLLRRAKRLYGDGNAIRDQVINPRRPDAVKLVPCDIMGSELVGGEDVLRRIKGSIKEDRVGIIGIHGEAGVGKTSILQIINNEFLYTEARSRFDMAIWVKVPASSVPQEVVSSIQTTIAQRLEVTLPADTPAAKLFQELCGMRFILLLDDVCETLDLKEIGIPRPITVNNRSKILFTTSLEHVCNEMRADQVEMVDVLDPVKSWDLFRSQFRCRAADFLNDPDNRKRAQVVAAGCGGVPTLLIDAGKKMAIDAVKQMTRTTNNLPDEINRSGPPAAEPSEGTGRAPHS